MGIDHIRKTSVAGLLVLSATIFLPPVDAAPGNGLSLATTPSSLNVGSVKLGSTSPASTVTLSNTGNGNISFTSIAVSGDFAETHTCGTSLAKNAQCTVSITFKPTAVGARTGTLTITDNLTTPQTVPLSGTGVGIPAASLSTASLNFANQNLGSPSTAQIITLSNTGSAALSIMSLGITGTNAGDYAQTNTCGTSVAAGGNCAISVTFTPTAAGSRTGTLSVMDNAVGAPHTVPLAGTGVNAGSNITGIWANEGGDKVTQDELRATHKTENLTGTVLNRAWDGTTVRLAGARNESISFNLVLEAANAPAPRVSVSFDTLIGPNGAKIQTTAPATGGGVFQWLNRPIELFYTRYLAIHGLSFFGWYMGDEQEFPARFQATSADRSWTSRPDHDKNYPDILVPLELVPTFDIASGQNQSIWADIFIPKGTPAGTYTGTVTVKENGVVTHTVPVSLTVQNFSLPDTPSVKQFTYVNPDEIMQRYVAGNGGYVNWQTPQGQQVKAIADTYFQFFHRHRIDLIGGETECPNPGTAMCTMNLPRFTGSLYTPANGYDGPGVNQGTSIYAIGPYGTWGRNIYDAATMQQFADGWESWFQQNLPHTTHFVYLEDEPPASDFPMVENWAQWMAQSSGPGQNLLSLATVSRSQALLYMPDLKVAMEVAGIGDCGALTSGCDVYATTTQELAHYQALPNRHVWEYNLSRPAVGTSNTEDDGTAMRTIAWVQYKKGIERWFYWFANLATMNVDWFTQACTWSCTSNLDPAFGQFGGNSTNGNGLLVYPGTDVINTANSYGVPGPFASLRLKEWRRGIEDGDYLTLASQIDPVTTQALVQQVMPKALWENPAPNNDPSWYLGPVSWSSNPDNWEAARAQLASIISNACQSNPTASYCQ